MTQILPDTGKLEAAVKECGDLARLDLDPQSNRLWIVFSHVDIPVGKFAQSRALARLSGSKLFLNCLDNSWYCKGINDFSASMATTIIKLLEIAEDFDTIFLGHSMGAYAALLCGSYSDKTRFISTSPELELGLEFSRSWRNNAGFKPTLDRLNPHKDAMTEPAKGIVLFGIYDPIDAYFMANLGELGTTNAVYEVPHHHGVTEYFTSHSSYLHVLNSQAGQPGNLDLLKNKGHIADPFTFGTPEEYAHFYEVYRQFNRASNGQSLRAGVSLHSDWENPGWQELRAKVWMSLEEPIFALDAAYRAYRFQPDLMQFIATYATACLKLDERKRLCTVLDGMTEAQRRHALGQRIIERTNATYGMLFRSRIGGGMGEPRRIDVSHARPAKPVTPEDRTGQVDIEAMNKAMAEENYASVLNMTAPEAAGNMSQDIRVVRARALALLEAGDKATGLRLLRDALKQNEITEPLAKACLLAAAKMRSTEFISLYMDLEIEPHVRSANIGLVQKALGFVTEPYLVSRILIELAIYSRTLDRSLKLVKAHLRPLGISYTVGKLLPQMIRADDLPENPRRALAQFIATCGLRASAYAWLNKRSHFDASEDSPSALSPDLDLYFPTEDDYIQGLRLKARREAEAAEKEGEH